LATLVGIKSFTTVSLLMLLYILLWNLGVKKVWPVLYSYFTYFEYHVLEIIWAILAHQCIRSLFEGPWDLMPLLLLWLLQESLSNATETSVSQRIICKSNCTCYACKHVHWQLLCSQKVCKIKFHFFIVVWVWCQMPFSACDWLSSPLTMSCTEHNYRSGLCTEYFCLHNRKPVTAANQ
jgi:hypothetical protein